jgi:NTP pyrophosphatase (non-canonical NTP hydrolase)
MAGEFEVAIDSVRQEAEASAARYNGFNSTHEALGVLLEEFDELRAAIHANDMASISREAMQVSAVALRLHDICERALAGEADTFAKRSGA